MVIGEHMELASHTRKHLVIEDCQTSILSLVMLYSKTQGLYSEPLHARAKGQDHVIVRALDSHPKVVLVV